MGISRGRFRALLASSSVAALLVGGGAPAAFAAPCNHTITSSFDNPAGSTVTNVCVFNTQLAGSIINNGTISPSGIALINGWIVGGSIKSSGIIGGGISLDSASKIIANGVTAIRITGPTFTGGITNRGAITDDSYGIFAYGNSTFSGSITNSVIGSISAGEIGIVVDGVTTFMGGTSNSGSIVAGFSGIRVLGVTTYMGGISNSGVIIATRDDGIAVTNVAIFGSTSAGGGISNSGTISAATGISVVTSTIDGAIVDTGTIEASSHGILIDSASEIVTTKTTIAITGPTFTGGISNAGTISASGAYAGISIAGVTNFAGGISNAGTITGETGIVIGAGVTFAAGSAIVNSGSISGTGGTAIDASAATSLATIDQVAGTISGNIKLSTKSDALNISGGTIAGNIVGSGMLDTVNFQTGTAYTDSNTFTTINQVNVDSGTTLVLNSTGNSATFVDVYGILTGNGAIDPLTMTIHSGATFAPGNGIPGSAMTITGNLAFQSGALYAVYLNPSTSTYATITGTAALAGTVDATFATGSYAAKRYTILKSSGLNGTTFAGLATNLTMANFTESLSYTADDVFLNINAALGAGTPLDQSQQNVANALNTFFNTGPTLPAGFANLFNLSGTQLGAALTRLDGEDATGAQTGAFTLMNEFLELMAGNAGGAGAGGNGGLGFAPDQQTELPPDIALAYDSILKAPPPSHPSPASGGGLGWGFDNRWSVWGSGFGGSSSFEGNAAVGSNNVTTTTYGSAAGMEYRPDGNTRLGFALAGAGLNWGLAHGLGTGRSDAFLAGAYGKRYFGPAYISGAAAFGNNWFTTNRTAAFGDQLSASFTGQSYAIRGEAGYRYAVSMSGALIGVTPYGALQTQWFHTPAYSETDLTGGGFGLSYTANTANDTRSELGARFDNLTAWNNKPLILRSSLAWAHDWVSGTGLNAAFQALPGSAFTVNGAAVPPDSALTTASAQYYFTPDLSFIAKFDGEFAPSAQTYAGSGTLKYTF